MLLTIVDVVRWGDANMTTTKDKELSKSLFDVRNKRREPGTENALTKVITTDRSMQRKLLSHL